MKPTKREIEEMMRRTEDGALIARTVPPDERTDEEWLAVFAWMALYHSRARMYDWMFFAYSSVVMLVVLLLTIFTR